MKSNCVGLADLLCAYADGELAEDKKQIVEDHLAICENCSAVLKIYREISTSVNESNVPAPDALRIGVMNRIQSEEIPRAADNRNRRGSYRFILTRYAPIAACLVVMLLVWQFWGNLRGSPNDAGMPAPADAPIPMMDAAWPAPEAEAGMAAAPPAEASLQTAGDNGSGYPEEALDESLDDADESPGSRMHPSNSLTAEEEVQIANYFNNAYAEITIIGELPAFLAGYEPLSFNVFGWEILFEIPSAEIQVLLDELGNREGLTVTHNNENSPYAIVLYSSGE